MANFFVFGGFATSGYLNFLSEVIASKWAVLRRSYVLSFWEELFCNRMSRKRPQFAVGHTVREKLPFGNAIRDKGIVIKRYELDGDYRYVVKFESGREEVFFERELIADQIAPD